MAESSPSLAEEVVEALVPHADSAHLWDRDKAIWPLPFNPGRALCGGTYDPGKVWVNHVPEVVVGPRCPICQALQVAQP